ncbi:MAG: G5 domain-containing protein, partial [Clostridia bacterium]|nr:G5 domain-containing protein [Clostridia bacterium]
HTQMQALRRRSQTRLRRQAMLLKEKLAGMMSLSDLVRSAKRHSLFVPIVVASVLLAICVCAFCIAAGAVHTVTLEHDGVSVSVESFDSTVAQILEENGISVGPHDVVTPALDQPVNENTSIVIARAIAIDVTDGLGQTVTCYAVDGTVGQLLKDNDYELGELDEVTPSLSSQIAAGMHVQIDRIEHEELTYTQAIPYETVYEDNSSMYSGSTRVTQKGSDGEMVVTERIVYRNGEEDERLILNEEVTLEAVTCIVQRGTKSRPVSGVTSAEGGVLTLNDGTQLSYSSVISGSSTAYTHTGHNTATGTKPAYGTIAVDPSVIPLGTRMYIPGYGYGVARDTGGAIKGTRIDVFFETRSEAIRWGRRSVTIYILD